MKQRLPCRTEDPELFFPIGEGPLAEEQESLAISICQACPITEACLDYALTTGQAWGIWGATTPAMRRTISRKRTVELRGKHEDHRTRTELVRELASQ